MRHPRSQRDEPGAATERDVSFAERGLWFLHQAGGGLCNVSAAMRIRSSLAVDRLSAAAEAVATRHDLLRTGYELRDGELRAVVRPDVHLEAFADHLPGIDDAELARVVDAEHRRPFDMTDSGLVRLRVWTRDTEDHVVLVTMHHAIVDWTGMVVWAEEIATHYASAAPSDPPNGATYADFVTDQRAMLGGPDGDAGWRYWRTALPAERPEPPVAARVERTGPGRRQETIPFSIDELGKSRIERAAWTAGVPVHLVMLGLWLDALHAVGGAPTIVVGLPRTLRRRRFARTIGCFINTIPLVADLSDDPPLDKLIERVRKQLSEAISHQAYPIELIAQRLPDLGAVPGRPPVYDVTFNYVPTDAGLIAPMTIGARPDMETHLGGMRVAPFPAPPSIGPSADFSLSLTEFPGRFLGLIGYDADLFDRDTTVWLYQSIQESARAL